MKKYKNMLKLDEFKDFFTRFDSKTRRIVLIENSPKRKKQSPPRRNFSPPKKKEKDFSDIAQSIEMNMEKLHNSLNKYTKGRNTQNRITSSKSVQYRTNQELKSRNLEF